MEIQNIKEDSIKIAFQIILHAGNAKTAAQNSVTESSKGNFDKAHELIDVAILEIKEAHLIQTKLIQDEISNEQEIELSLLIIHSQDHFAMASTAIDYAKQFLELYKRVEVLENK